MGYSFFGEEIQSRSGTPFDRDNKREHQRRFRVGVDRKEDSNDDFVCKHPSLPFDYSIYTDASGQTIDSFALLIRKSAVPQNEGDWQYWIVTCDYSTDVGNQKKNQQQQNDPEKWGWNVHWEAETITKAEAADMYGIPWLNSAFDYYKPGPVTTYVRPILVFTKNQNTFGPDQIDQWSNVCNDRPFLGRPYGCVQCMPPTGEESHHGPIRFFRVTYRLKFGAKYPDTRRKQKFRTFFNPDAADISPFKAANYKTEVIKESYERMDTQDLVDQGYKKLETVGPNIGRQVPITADTRNVGHPHLLDGTGQPLNLKEQDPELRDKIMEVNNRFFNSRYDDLNKLLIDGFTP